MNNLKALSIVLAVSLVLLAATAGGAIADRLFGIKPLDRFFPKFSENGGRELVTEESAVVDAAEKVSPSVVTVSVQTQKRRVLQFSPFGGFSSRIEGGTPQDIGSGFIVSPDGLIVTNKHVVSGDSEYKVITKDGTEYEVKQVSRDPSNDIAVIKIDASGLKPVELGDSSNLKVGQFVIAIGTALGEFRHTVTTGVISGLGRGITAGSAFEGYVEELDNVIQTDAAINPGNSGGPLLNSTGAVIGINVAVAEGAQNIGFAIPVNVVKGALDLYKANGSFPAKAYLGVEYQMIVKEAALLNSVPEGAYVINVVASSPAEIAGLKSEDIITKIDEERIDEKSGGLSKIISGRSAGDKISVELWRDGETKTVEVTLSEFSQ